MKYILKGHKPVEEKDVLKWAKWYETANRRVGKTKIGIYTVFTSFLGLDHSFGLAPGHKKACGWIRQRVRKREKR